MGFLFWLWLAAIVVLIFLFILFLVLETTSGGKRVTRLIEGFGGFSGLLRLSPRYNLTSAVKTWGIPLATAVPFNTNRQDGSRDASNEKLRAFLAIALRKGYTVFAQRETAPEGAQYVLDTSMGQHVETGEFFKWASRQHALAGTSVIVFGHRHHVRRCAAVAHYHGFAPFVSSDAKDVPYDPYGGQWWCRNAWLYIPWEYASRGFFILKAFLGKL